MSEIRKNITEAQTKIIEMEMEMKNKSYKEKERFKVVMDSLKELGLQSKSIDKMFESRDKRIEEMEDHVIGQKDKMV